MPVRMNSKRILNKNIQKICETPLFCWSLNKLNKLNIPVYIYSNWPDVLEKSVITRYVKDFKKKYENVTLLKRPHELDDDATTGIEIYQAFAKEVPSKNYMLVHCTSPFVKFSTYQKVLNQVTSNGFDSAFTVRKYQTFVWYKDKSLNFQTPRPRTQDISPVYVESSGAYAYKSWVLDEGARSGGLIDLVEVDEFEAIDIDDPQDMEYARKVALYQRIEEESEYDY